MSRSVWKGLIPAHSILLMLTVVLFKDGSPQGYGDDLLFITLLIGLGTFVYLNTSKMPAAGWFIVCMYMAAWILLLLNGPSRGYYAVGRVLMSLAPNALFMFFVHFTELPRKAPYRKWNRLLLGSALATAAALLSFRAELAYMLFLHLLVMAASCIRLSVYYRARQRRVLNWERTVLNVSIWGALLPFITAYTFLRHFLTDSVKFNTIYALILVPAAAGCILMKRSRPLRTHLNYMYLLKLTAFVLTGAALLVLFSSCLLGITLFQTLLLLYAGTILFYSCLLYQRRLATRHLNMVNQAREKMEKERQDILQKVTYDQYLSTLSNLIRQLIDRTIALDGTLIIWKEDGRSYVLEQSGVFEPFSLRKYDTRQLQESIGYFAYGTQSYYSFPLKYRNEVHGWLIAGHKRGGDKFTPDEVNTILVMADTICEILKTTEILHRGRQRRILVPTIRQEDYVNVTMKQKEEDIRKSIALYLHDDVLQPILALRNMTEVLHTRQSDVRELMLDTLGELNASIRDRMFDIYPTTLADLGLVESLGILCGKMKREAVHRPGLQIRLDAEPGLDPGGELAYALFRMIKELLTNAVKHADASEIVVSLYATDRDLLIADVTDNGKGFDSEDCEDGMESGRGLHIGLLSIRQEVSVLRGEFSIRSGGDCGTHAQIKIPLKEADKDYAHYAV
ncbi:sensor histidine kinase [Paenibacillus spiritus]|nr:ATP-binding protein [Paenibacillus spiritus]